MRQFRFAKMIAAFLIGKFTPVHRVQKVELVHRQTKI